MEVRPECRRAATTPNQKQICTCFGRFCPTLGWIFMQDHGILNLLRNNGLYARTPGVFSKTITWPSIRCREGESSSAKTYGGLLLVGGAKTLSEYHQSALEQCIEPQKGWAGKSFSCDPRKGQFGHEKKRKKRMRDTEDGAGVVTWG